MQISTKKFLNIPSQIYYKKGCTEIGQVQNITKIKKNTKIVLRDRSPATGQVDRL